MSVNPFNADKVQGAFSRVFDLVCLVAAFAATSSLVSFLGRSRLFIWPAPTSSDIDGWPAQYIIVLLAAMIGWNIIGAYSGIEKREQTEPPNKHVRHLLRAALLWMGWTTLAIFIFRLHEVSRLFVLFYILLASALVTICECAGAIAARQMHRRRGMRRVAVIIGNGAQAHWLRQFLLDNYCPEPYALIRQVGPEQSDYIDQTTTPNGNGHRGPRHDTVEVFVAAADIGTDVSALFPRLFNQGGKVHIVPGIFDTSIFKLSLGSIGQVPTITLRPGALTALELVLKRLVDLMVASVLLMATAPVIAIIALLIKLSSPGPVFFRQERIGKGGRRIHIYKFRTMHRNAEQMLKSDPELYQKYIEGNYKLPKGKDPRITSIGRVLRELSLDEIPQLINVVKGEMSLVGPRPIVPAEIEKYADYAPLLLSVRPGLTGQWQVSGRSDIADYARRVRLDMEYIRDQSVTKDLHILFRTVPVVLSREGAQ
jgi:exopolysaccharide production protein ExoY